MTALFNNDFFTTVDEDEEESLYNEDWRAMEIKLQVLTALDKLNSCFIQLTRFQ